MFAVIDTESLKDPRIINSFKPVKVVIEYEPNSEANKFHHVFFLRVNNKGIDKQIFLFASEMKNGWYAFFWNEKIFYIVFNQQSFIINLPFSETNKEYQKAQEYGKSVGIQEEFLDFNEYFQRYKNLTTIKPTINL